MEEFGFNLRHQQDIRHDDIMTSIVFIKYGTILLFLVFVFIWCKRYEIPESRRIRGREVFTV